MFSPADLRRRVWKAEARGWGCRRLQLGSVRKLQGGINKQGQEVRTLITVGRRKAGVPCPLSQRDRPRKIWREQDRALESGCHHCFRILCRAAIGPPTQGPRDVSCLVGSWEEALPEA